MTDGHPVTEIGVDQMEMSVGVDPLRDVSTRKFPFVVLWTYSLSATTIARLLA